MKLTLKISEAKQIISSVFPHTTVDDIVFTTDVDRGDDPRVSFLEELQMRFPDGHGRSGSDDAVAQRLLAVKYMREKYRHLSFAESKYIVQNVNDAIRHLKKHNEFPSVS